ncbi:hypothetical protein QVD17_01552 [Tagetes erecta]|uniref:Uncharacterized protein n=1 Tax=Tagetes erecta TaxID=13708 RepID=A0AAD8P6W9_TARER|nr:hypothetical protein QVD17_01552 [Tagetes erecta]
MLVTCLIFVSSFANQHVRDSNSISYCNFEYIYNISIIILASISYVYILYKCEMYLYNAYSSFKNRASL